MSAFDSFLVVDWSGGNDKGPRPCADAIWACVARGGRSEEPLYLRNRQVAETWLADFFETERAAGRRVLAGLDFPFGYPTGFCRALTGTDNPLALWDWFETQIEDAPESNNRFDIAGRINREHGGRGPFWANALKRDIEGLPRNKQDYHNPFTDKRRAETKAPGAFTCWQMAGAGAVGSQVMMGLPVLARLRQRFGAAAWPFEPLDADIALVEVWPSLTLGKEPAGVIRDAWQVSETARALSLLTPDALSRMLSVDAPEEGWILGLGCEEELRAAASLPPVLTNSCFALPPGVHWTPVADALAHLRSNLAPVTARKRVAVASATGLVTAEPVEAQRSNPPLPNTAVDGYGFTGGREEGVHRLPLATQRAAAGDAPVDLPQGTAMRVLTGAALPAGVDTVVLQEDVTVTDGFISFRGPVRTGSNTRKAGEDVVAGDIAVPQGQRIGAPEAALLAATGVQHVTVHDQLRVAVLSTGAELVEAGDTAGDGQIFDANRPMLLELIRRMGHSPVDMGRVDDDRAALRARLDAAAEQADVILTSGGASAGDEDHVSALLEETGTMTMWRIAVKPGRPLALGLWDRAPVFGLPGNPVAALVCALVFARPAIAVLAGETWPEPQGFDVPAAFHKSKKEGRSEYLRARLRNGAAEVFPSEGSGRISGLAWADGLVELPMEAAEIAPGTSVRYIPFSSFGL
ncbi:gephyrin-like molybdotransferase Glp [uncultured Roseobacter sp.]|uniref:molybdopterin-binding protein n=1 Tax=uncultured Roseobacter sp. TaxID=114847 RepID=UPI0026368AE9|nr:gephyrin-like molybdotransferase Glp [uncultured Roseobacter sp.]